MKNILAEVTNSNPTPGTQSIWEHTSINNVGKNTKSKHC